MKLQRSVEYCSIQRQWGKSERRKVVRNIAQRCFSYDPGWWVSRGVCWYIPLKERTRCYWHCVHIWRVRHRPPVLGHRACNWRPYNTTRLLLLFFTNPLFSVFSIFSPLPLYFFLPRCFNFSPSLAHRIVLQFFKDFTQAWLTLSAVCIQVQNEIILQTSVYFPIFRYVSFFINKTNNFCYILIIFCDD